MSNEDINKKLKEILNTMNSSETNLETFFELIERETGGKLTFSALKTYLDKHYEVVNKSTFINIKYSHFTL
jgi:hypothetical protein